MKFILVWVLVTASPHGVLSYSPPMQSEKECGDLILKLDKLNHGFSRNKCVQLNILVGN